MNNLVSIVLPVYNTEKYIFEAVTSCLNQTYKNIELIIIDNYSTDNTLKIIEQIIDDRIILIKNPKNMGLIYSLNIGFKTARGKYIARMDADDICFLNRIEKQVNYLDNNIELSLIGGGIIFIDPDGKIKGQQRYLLTEHEQIKCDALFRCPLNHPTIMFNRAHIQLEINIGLYKEEYFTAEDYELWARMLEKYKAGNLSSPILYYRRHLTNLSVTHGESQKRLAFEVVSKYAKTIYKTELPPSFFEEIQSKIPNSLESNTLLFKSQIQKFKLIDSQNLYFKLRFNLFILDIFFYCAFKKKFFLAASALTNLYVLKLPESILCFIGGILKYYKVKIINSSLTKLST